MPTIVGVTTPPRPPQASKPTQETRKWTAVAGPLIATARQSQIRKNNWLPTIGHAIARQRRQVQRCSIIQALGAPTVTDNLLRPRQENAFRRSICQALRVPKAMDSYPSWKTVACYRSKVDLERAGGSEEAEPQEYQRK
jgi:hypothetical protein